MHGALLLTESNSFVNKNGIQEVGQMLGTLIKKKIKFFLIYKEIQKGAVAKSFMTNCLLSPHTVYS
jgi:hypothetical protein